MASNKSSSSYGGSLFALLLWGFCGTYSEYDQYLGDIFEFSKRSGGSFTDSRLGSLGGIRIYKRAISSLWTAFLISPGNITATFLLASLRSKKGAKIG